MRLKLFGFAHKINKLENNDELDKDKKILSNELRNILDKYLQEAKSVEK